MTSPASTNLLAQITATEYLPRLPTFEEATTGQNSDVARLPSYTETRRARFHPYARRIPVLKNDTDRLFNTIYDDECIVLEVPPARLGPRPAVAPLVPTFPIDRQEAERTAFERRVQRVTALILNEFVAGLTRAIRG